MKQITQVCKQTSALRCNVITMMHSCAHPAGTCKVRLSVGTEQHALFHWSASRNYPSPTQNT